MKHRVFVVKLLSDYKNSTRQQGMVHVPGEENWGFDEARIPEMPTCSPFVLESGEDRSYTNRYVTMEIPEALYNMYVVAKLKGI